MRTNASQHWRCHAGRRAHAIIATLGFFTFVNDQKISQQYVRDDHQRAIGFEQRWVGSPHALIPWLLFPSQRW